MNILLNSTFQRIIMVVAIVILLLMWKNSVDSAKIEKATLEQNIKALADTSKMYETKAGELIAERKLYLGENEDLEKYNKKLTEELDKLKKEKPGTEVITIIDNTVDISGFSGDSTNTENEYSNGLGKLSWAFERQGNGWAKVLSGYTEYSINQLEDRLNIIAGNTIIVQDSLLFKVTSYVVENEDGSFSAITKSSYPGMILETSGALFPTKIEDIPIIEKKRRVSLGIQTGLGINPIEIYNGGTSPMVVYVGIGINYELKTLFKW